jgi:hypothetical protein
LPLPSPWFLGDPDDDGRRESGRHSKSRSGSTGLLSLKTIQLISKPLLEIIINHSLHQAQNNNESFTINWRFAAAEVITISNIRFITQFKTPKKKKKTSLFCAS